MWRGQVTRGGERHVGAMQLHGRRVGATRRDVQRAQVLQLLTVQPRPDDRDDVEIAHIRLVVTSGE